jgi:hypothetical protein
MFVNVNDHVNTYLRSSLTVEILLITKVYFFKPAILSVSAQSTEMAALLCMSCHCINGPESIYKNMYRNLVITRLVNF